MSERVDAIVIGAGVVGLAVARSLSMSGKEVIIVEADKAIGMGTSSRNSEVIHAGIYYPKDSLKAKLCVSGKEMLYDFCDSHGVPYNKMGKLIVATSTDQLDALKALKQKAADNGVNDLVWLSKEEALQREPNLNCEAALLSPSTGIIDTHAFMLALQGDAEEHGAMLALNSPALSGSVTDDGIALEIGGEMPMSITADIVINAAGLSAIKLARLIDGLDAKHIPDDYFCKGNYFSLGCKAPFSHLIYPVPEKAGLGVHLTLDMGGQARFGPDVEWLDDGNDIDYEVDPKRGDIFYDAIRTYWPDLKDGDLHADYSGVRPKIQAPGEEARDFLIQGPSVHGILGFINLFGIESPGLTSSLAIAQEVMDELKLK
ncbi:NAD(P)/FAD-dependent oxidoreductase [Terasakiella sp. A23]|uniref:NAD(P)/FAD-dependent oxidoreductase n=1 Tax=Terasakiella sp. FCG-A23 TaxID=3080561 RepID=UPI0029543ECF|nr:NAD(P)/FAD-dependent oxidoreductase [Terasakiella sp. A23]MDV7338553.1 NAD(P)/FAD-dependent oxidoreductase [Terasakiella sp. A23]